MDLVSIRPLSKFLSEKAANELNEIPSRIPNDLELLKEWIKKQPHLVANTDDQFLIGFLRGCKHSLERAKQKIEMHYSVRTALPEFFSERDPENPDFIRFIKKGMISLLPKPHPDGPRIVVYRPTVYDADLYDIINYIKYTMMVTEKNMAADDHAAVCGYYNIVDLSGYKSNHMAQVSVGLIKKLGDVLKSASVRLRILYFINFPSFLAPLVDLVAKKIFPEKFSKRIHVLPNLESLYKYIPKDCLPAEYGGHGGTFSEIASQMMEKDLTDTNWFVEESKYRCHESAKSGLLKKEVNAFGIDGSFRSLTID